MEGLQKNYNLSLEITGQRTDESHSDRPAVGTELRGHGFFLPSTGLHSISKTSL